MAGRAAFRFETLLRLRRQREDQAKRVVAARLRTLGELRHRQSTLEDHIAEQLSLMRASLPHKRVEVDELRWGRHWLARLQRGLLTTEAEIAANRAALAQERSALVATGKDTKVLEKLKERRQLELIREAERREQIELDEMNVSRFARQGMFGAQP